MKYDWVSTSYRRHLADMHIEDWDETFLSRFRPEDYVKNLLQAKIQTPMLYLQSHVGHCYWPTKSGHMHAALRGREDLMRQLVNLCHENGMSVIGYYSVIFNTYEEERHPEWRLRDKDGFSQHQRGQRYGHLCPNVPEHRAFVETQIQEMAEYFDLDGIFYDMLFWPQFCHCDHCKARWAEESGGLPIPETEDWYDNTWQLWVRKHQEWMGDFAMWLRKTTHKYLPGIPIEMNYANAVASDWSVASSEYVNEACDYTGGDLYGDLYNHSFTAKYYRGVTKTKPFEYMTCRCDANLQQHTVTKTEEHLRTEVMLTAAHHGATLVIDAIDPVGTLDSRLYHRLGKIFESHIPYEPYFHGTPMADVAVYYCTRGRYDRDGVGFHTRDAAVGAVRDMIQNHVAVDVISEGYPGDFSEFPVVMVPYVGGLLPKERQRLIDYVKNGGTLYLSGVLDEELFTALTGGKFLGMTKETRTYMAPTADAEPLFGWFNAKYPMPYEYKLPLVQLPEGAKCLAAITLPYTDPAEAKFASIHSNPPGIGTEYPALALCGYGKGQVLWCAAAPEADQRSAYRSFVRALVDFLLPEEGRCLTSTAPKQVELVAHKTETGFQVSAVDLLCDEEMLPVPAFTVSLKCEKKPAAVTLVPFGQSIPFTWENGVVSWEVNFTQFSMFEIVL